MNIKVVDSINGSTVATTTVPINSDITSWLNSLTVPTHDGYVFDRWEITAGYITNVTDNATVYIRYTEPGGGTETQSISTYVNGDGDIVVDTFRSGWDFTGSATIAIQMSKTFDSVVYESYDIYEFNTADGENGAKTDATISGDTITFTDEKIETHNFYRIGLFNNSGNRVGQTAWDAGFKPIKLRVTVDGINHDYDVVSN